MRGKREKGCGRAVGRGGDGEGVIVARESRAEMERTVSLIFLCFPFSGLRFGNVG